MATTSFRVRARVPRVTPFGALVVVVLAPVAVAVVSVVGSHWYATADYVFEVLRIDDVGGRHTPLVGPYSRFGFDHPGPLLFWVLAPFHLAFGDTGVLVGAGMVNAAAITGALFIARRRGGLPLSTLVGVAVLLLMQGLGSSLLIDPWNPWIPVLPFLAFMLLAWSIAERDFAMLPWLVGVGSFVVQSHIGYAPLVVGLGGLAAVLARTHSHATRIPGELRRWTRVTAAVFGCCWIAPVIEQLTGNPGNLSEIVDYFRDPAESPIGWSAGFGIMGVQLRFPGAWVTGDDTSAIGTVASGTTVPALALLGATALLAGVCWRRKHPDVTRLALLALTGAALGVSAGARATGITGPYVVRWWFVLAATVWCSIAWSLWTLSAPIRVGRGKGIVRAIPLVGLVALAVVTAADAVSTRMPVEDLSDTVRGLAPLVADELAPEGSFLVTWVDARTLGAVGTGVYLALYERGFDVKLRPYHVAGNWRTARPDEVDTILLVVSGDALEDDWPIPAGAVRIATYDPLTPSERGRISELTTEIRASVDPPVASGSLRVDLPAARQDLVDRGADPRLVAELGELRSHSAHTVFLAAPQVAANIGA
ncbi:MAG: hypothetical protein ACT4OX_00100 [Actinomycetota bacterium]